MPIITIEGPRMSKEQKARLVKAFTDAASEVTQIPRDAFIVQIKENEPENVGIGGVLLSERKK